MRDRARLALPRMSNVCLHEGSCKAGTVVHAGAPRCIQVYTDARRCIQMHRGERRSHKCTQVHTGANRCTQEHTGEHRCRACRCTQVHTGIHCMSEGLCKAGTAADGQRLSA